MKLVMAIVNGDDSKEVIKKLMQEGFLVTKLASSGGFLRAGNVTLICGVHNERVELCLNLIENTCKAKKYTYKNMTPESSSLGIASGLSAAPGEIIFGGATVFVLDIEKSVKF